MKILNKNQQKIVIFTAVKYHYVLHGRFLQWKTYQLLTIEHENDTKHILQLISSKSYTKITALEQSEVSRPTFRRCLMSYLPVLLYIR